MTKRSIKRRSALLGWCCALAAFSCTDPAPPPPPNVLLVTIDTLRADRLGCYGHERDTSPNIDRLATEATLYENAISPSSWTLPAHASLLTGLHPSQHAVEKSTLALPESAETLAERFAAVGYETFAAVSHVYLSRRWYFDQGFDVFDDSVAEGSPHRPVAELIVDSALRWLGAREDDRPFFAWVHIFDPHWDYAPPPPFDRLYDPDYEGPMTGRYKSLKPYIRAISPGPPPPLAERDLEHLLALYDGEIAYADSHVGRLFDTLRERKQWTNTIVAVASDHGEEFMEHGSLEGHQWTLFDEVIHVPLVVKAAGNNDAARVERVVSTVMLPGTLLSLAGVEHTLGTLEDSKDDPDPAALLNLVAYGSERTIGLRTADYKLLRGPEPFQLRFFRDPGNSAEKEDVKLIDRQEFIAMLGRLDEILATHRLIPGTGRPRQSLDRRTTEKLRALGYTD